MLDQKLNPQVTNLAMMESTLEVGLWPINDPMLVPGNADTLLHISLRCHSQAWETATTNFEDALRLYDLLNGCAIQAH